jgi:Protein of unknown function (DUF3102)
MRAQVGREPVVQGPAAEVAEHAEVIRTLGKRVVADVIEIDRRLTEAKALAGHGRWLPWLEREFGWSDDTACKYMRVHAMVSKSELGSDLDLPLNALYLLARPSTPESARTEVLDRTEAGERMTHAQVKEIVDNAVNEARARDWSEHEAELERLWVVTGLSAIGAYHGDTIASDFAIC